jgi:hypothetical protein
MQALRSHGQLDQSIFHWMEILLLPRTGSTPATALSLSVLANLLRIRGKRFNQLDNIKNCVNYLRYFRDQRLQVVNISHDVITSRLVRALGDQVESRPSSDNVMKNINVVLYLELLNSDNPQPATRTFFSLYKMQGENFTTK